MTGIEIEYLLGIYFAVSSLGYPYPNGRFIFDPIKFIIGVVLIIFAAAGLSLIH